MRSHFVQLGTSFAAHYANRFRFARAAWLLISAFLMLAAGAWAESSEKVLYSFPAAGDDPTNSTLVIDKHGNLYGVANSADDNGVVFKLTHSGQQWSESVVYAFQGGSDGSGPAGGLIFNEKNLYGVTQNGGNDACSGGCGTIFELMPDGSGGWTESVLYLFSGGTDGANPRAVLFVDSAGNLYGTNSTGGDPSCGCGTVFELSPGAGGNWTESVLHQFAGGKDGSTPFFPVVVDQSGNVYGTALLGGKYNEGIVFELEPGQDGTWKETILHTFKGGRDGATPFAGLALFNGVLYGTTYSGGEVCGGDTTCGTVFQLKPGTGGRWTETVIHRFDGTDGIESLATPVLDASGNLFGTTFEGGSGTCGVCGTAFELSPTGDNNWKETVLHDFGAYEGDAGTPEAGMVLDGAGHLFGTSSLGGTNNSGTVYEIIP